MMEELWNELVVKGTTSVPLCWQHLEEQSRDTSLLYKRVARQKDRKASWNLQVGSTEAGCKAPDLQIPTWLD